MTPGRTLGDVLHRALGPDPTLHDLLRAALAGVGVYMVMRLRNPDAATDGAWALALHGMDGEPFRWE